MAKFGGYNGGGFGGGMNMQNLMKQAQKMQEEMLAKQEELKNSTVSSSVAGGLVSVEMTGEYKLTSIKIKPEAVDPEDVEMLEDMVKAAVNDCLTQITEKKNSTMGNLGGLM